MAIYPCDAHGARYQGPQQTTYPALIKGTATERRKMRLCPACFSLTTRWIADHLHDVTDEEVAPECADCGAVEAPTSVFVTVYARGAERVDYFGRVCEGDCAAKMRAVLFGATAAS